MSRCRWVGRLLIGLSIAGMLYWSINHAPINHVVLVYQSCAHQSCCTDSLTRSIAADASQTSPDERERKQLYDDVMEYSLVPGSIAQQQEVISEDFGGALKLNVALLCVNCGDPGHGWEGSSCPVPITLCSRPFPQVMSIPAGPLQKKRRPMLPDRHSQSERRQARTNPHH